MAIVPRSGLEVNYVHDDHVEAVEYNRINGIVSYQTQQGFSDLHGYGAFPCATSWIISAAGQVGPGTGYFPQGWYGETLINSDIVGTTDGALNYVFVLQVDATAPAKTVSFSANTTGVQPADSIYLGEMTLDAGGVVTLVDQMNKQCVYSSDQLFEAKILSVSGLGTAPDISAGATRIITVDYSHVYEFRIGGSIDFTVNAPFTVHIYEDWARGFFVARLTNTHGYFPQTANYSWTRYGIA